MNNDPQQNDRLYEHGYDVRLGRAAPTEATLSVSPLTNDVAPIASATLYGPFCKFSNTLPFKIPFRTEANAARWSVTVPDVCYWTPNLPLQYRLTLQFADGRSLTTWVALKLFGVRGVGLALDGARYVLRGYSTRGLELTATDDTAWQTLREQRAVLVMNDLKPSIVERAGWAGIPVLWDARGKSLQPADIVAARAQPAVAGIIATTAALSDPALQQAANELLWIIPSSDEPKLAELVDDRTQVAVLAEPSPSLKLSRERPTIVSTPLIGNPPLAERRKLCDELQGKRRSTVQRRGILCYKRYVTSFFINCASMTKTKFLSWLFMMVSHVVFAEQPPSKNDQANATPNEKEIQHLITKLAAKKAAPDHTDPKTRMDLARGVGSIEPGVEAAYKKLAAIGKSAFPVLLANLKDERYSLTRSYSTYVDHSVGYICGEIIENQVQVVGMGYKGRTGSDGKSHQYRDYMSEVYKGDLNKWWEENKEKSLKQMKLDALKWKIAWEEKIGFNDAKDREAIMPRLQKKLAEIEAEK